MNTKTLLSLNVMIAVVAIASIALITGVSEAPMVIADEENTKGLYKMADATQVVATFEFRDGVETVNIPDFSQDTDLTDTSRPTYSFSKVVGDTPLLHEATDVFQKFMGRDASYPHHFNDFESTVDVYADGKHVRAFEYSDCKINSYKIDTLSDKEEGYTTSKGFVVVESYTVECTGYEPHAIDYDTMVAYKKTTSNTLSSLDLIEQRAIWEQRHGIESSIDEVVDFNPSKMNSLERLENQAAFSYHRNN